MIELRQRGTGSWLDPRSSKGLACALSSRLWDRCRGHRGLCLTLTYDRTPYADAQDLYHRQSEEQHVPLFLRKVGRYLGTPLGGLWFCKLEFQKAGWVHWHVIILDVGRIPAKVLEDLWGHGFIKVRKLSPRGVRYVTKYVAKGDDVPAWIYGMRPRSVKIIRVSRGFWKPVEHPERIEDDAPPPEPDPLDEAPQRMDAYVPIGAKIEGGWERFTARDEDGNYKQGEADLGPLLVALLLMGCGVVGKNGGWLVVDATLDQLERASMRVAAETAVRRNAGRSASEARVLRADGSDRDLFNLIRTSKPDARLPGWLERFLWDTAKYEGGAA